MADLATRLFVGGCWIAGTGAVPVVDPGSGVRIAAVSTASTEQCLAAVDAAAEAMPGWASAPPRTRAEVLRRAYDLMIDERQALARLVTRENGKVLGEALREIDYAAEFFRWYSEAAVRVGGEIRRSPDGSRRIVVVPRPVGVALLVTPWNFPAAMATRKIAPALAAGCSVVLKPSPDTPLTALAVAAILERAGAPAGVVNVVLPEPPGEAVAAMLAHPALRKLSFTGSTAVGTELLRGAAQRVVDCSMELGGNAPFVVLPDADLDIAVSAALVAKLRNGGASCVAANRFYVHEDVAEPFTERFAAAMAARVVDHGLAPGAEVGSLVSAAQQTKVVAWVEEALARGARLRGSGPSWDGPGWFVRPTVVDHVPSDAVVLRREIFGPVAPIVTYGDTDDVVALANDTESGLIAYVMGGELGRALSVAEEMEVGMVAINSGVIADAAAPFGGAKASGLGREGGNEGIEAYLETKYIGVAW